MLNKGLVTQSKPDSIIAEEYRTIRTNLGFSAVHERTILITSPCFGDGKSTTTSNLAISLAQQGKRILVIDADLRKPTLHLSFGLDNTTGFTNVLSGEKELFDSIKKTKIEKVDLLSSGPLPQNPDELLNPHALKNLLKSSLNNYEMVLFDSPPVLEVTDARILANVCEAVILVLHSGKTDNKTALEAKRALQFAKANLRGIVLNKKA